MSAPRYAMTIAISWIKGFLLFYPSSLSLYSLPIDLLLQLKSPSQNLATDRDITFVTVCMDIHMHVRIYRYTYNIMQTSNSDCKTRCIISTSISTFSTCVSRGTLSSFLKVSATFSLRSPLSTQNHGESMEDKKIQNEWFLCPMSISWNTDKEGTLSDW